MYPKPMEAATVACRGGLLAQSSRPGIRARARTRGHGVSFGYSAPSAARRRPLLVASLGVGESIDSIPAEPLGEEAVVAEVHEDADDFATILPPPAKTVRVKFVLQKQCVFGQQFLLVGDDPALGQWDPAKAAALDWSEGHVWTVNTDLPANKLIEFKFLLRDDSGHVRWQHGGNRSLQTTETQNTLVVHEDWDHAKNQRVSEEEGEFAFAAEDVTFSDEPAGSTGAFLDDVSGEEELSIAAGYATFSDELAGSPGALLADDFQTGESLESNRSAVADASLPLRGEMKGANEEAQQQFILEKDHKLLDDIHGKADTALQNDDNAQLADRPSTSSIFENDLAWVVKALQQLLRFLGFQIGTTRT